jgi:hypothetical protein
LWEITEQNCCCWEWPPIFESVGNPTALNPAPRQRAILVSLKRSTIEDRGECLALAEFDYQTLEIVMWWIHNLYSLTPWYSGWRSRTTWGPRRNLRDMRKYLTRYIKFGWNAFNSL